VSAGAAGGGGAAQSLAEEVVDLIARTAKVPRERLAPETDLRRDLRFDSLMGLKVLAALEKRYGFTVPDEEIDRCRTVGAAVALVERLAGGAARAG
jgi:acyl carrier protein